MFGLPLKEKHLFKVTLLIPNKPAKKKKSKKTQAMILLRFSSNQPGSTSRILEYLTTLHMRTQNPV